MSLQPVTNAADDAGRAWHLFGLTADLVAERVVRPARREAARFLGNGYPTGTGGYVLWAERNRWLRLLMEAQGWIYDETYNVPCLIDPARTKRLVIVRGDVRTGQPGLPGPRALYPRGPATMFALEQNEEYQGFEALRTAEDDHSQALNTWYLILSEDATQTYMELSLPLSDGKANFGSYVERLLLTPVVHEPGLDIDPQAGASGPVIDIDILPN